MAEDPLQIDHEPDPASQERSRAAGLATRIGSLLSVWPKTAPAGSIPSLPKAFTLDRLSLDREPTDDELLILLGSSHHTDSIVLTERDGLLTARAQVIPKFAATWVIFLACVITALPWILPLFGSRVDAMVWAMILMMWLFGLPAILGVLHMIQQHYAAQGDYFRVDERRRTLEIPPLGVVLEANQIAYFTELDRWHSDSDGCRHIRLIGALVKRESGGYELLPVVREGVVYRRRSTAERLSRIFGKQTRKIKLGFGASRRLRDSE